MDSQVCFLSVTIWPLLQSHKMLQKMNNTRFFIVYYFKVCDRKFLNTDIRSGNSKGFFKQKSKSGLSTFSDIAETKQMQARGNRRRDSSSRHISTLSNPFNTFALIKGTSKNKTASPFTWHRHVDQNKRPSPFLLGLCVLQQPLQRRRSLVCNGGVVHAHFFEKLNKHALVERRVVANKTRPIFRGHHLHRFGLGALSRNKPPTVAKRPSVDKVVLQRYRKPKHRSSRTVWPISNFP